MNFSTSIKFSNNLIENESCIITYSGYLFQNNSDSVSIVYGYDSEWKHTTEQLMEKTDDGFVAVINVQKFDTLNFCFRNSSYEWDNNNNQNYSSPIAKQEQLDESFILNENVLVDILDNLFAIDLSTCSKEQLILLQDHESESLSSFEVEVKKYEPLDIEDSLVNSSIAETLDNDLENIFNDIYEEATSVHNLSENQNILSETPIAEKYEQNVSEHQAISNIEENSFDLNSLIDDILSPIVNSSVFEEDSNKSVENHFSASNSSEISYSDIFDEFEEFDEDSNVDKKIDTLIAELFNNTKEFSNKLSTNNSLQLNTIDDDFEDIVTTKIESKKLEDLDSELNTLATTNVITSNISVVEDKIIDNENVVNFIENEITDNENIVNFVEDEISDNENVINFIEDEITDNNNITNFIEEESLMDSLNENTSLIEASSENNFIVSPRALSKFYMFKKKIKLVFQKLFVAIPKLLSKDLDTDKNY